MPATITRHPAAAAVLLAVLAFAVVILATYITGAATGYGWGIDSHGTDLWVGSNNSYCFWDLANHAAGCESAQ